MRTSRLALLGVTVSAATMLGVAAATPANASAFGCQYIGGFGFDWQGLSLRAPKGFLCHKIDGSGRTIRNEAASYGPAPSLYGLLTGRVCNWRIDFVYRRGDTGAVYRVDRGPTHPVCGYAISRNVSADKTLAYYGTACAELYVNGVRRSSQCHNITR